MTTLTISPNPANGSLRLTITADAEVYNVFRSDANGAREVRVSPGTFPSPAGVIVLDDYEPALLGSIRYRVADAGAGAVVDIRWPEPVRPQITIPFRPVDSAGVDTVTGYGAARTGATTLHYPLDAKFPVPVFGKLRARAGSLEMLTHSYQEAMALLQVLETLGVLMLRQPDQQGMDMYFAATNAGLTSAGRKWIVRADYAEVEPPVGPIGGNASYSRAYSTIKAENGTYAALKVNYSTYEEVLEGKAS